MTALYKDYELDKEKYAVLSKELEVDAEALHDRAQMVLGEAEYCQRKYSRESIETGVITVPKGVIPRLLS